MQLETMSSQSVSQPSGLHLCIPLLRNTSFQRIYISLKWQTIVFFSCLRIKISTQLELATYLYNTTFNNDSYLQVQLKLFPSGVLVRCALAGHKCFLGFITKTYKTYIYIYIYIYIVMSFSLWRKSRFTNHSWS
jgi:hypothetical protein